MIFQPGNAADCDGWAAPVGAITSAQLLRLSGIGPRALLQEFGKNVVCEPPGVGENLQDHLKVYVQHRCKKRVSMAPHLLRRRRPWIGLQWLAGKGPA